MKRFEHIAAATLDEAVAALREADTQIIAGGTDILGVLKDEILACYPGALVDLKTIAGLDYIREDDDVLRIGALTRIADIARDNTVGSGYPALAKAARMVGSPQIREMGTLGGNICQAVRCWYFRSPDNRFYCLRKGGRSCPAADGDSRYHSIFGRSRGCWAVNPSDLAPVLVALDARIETTKRLVEAEGFFQARGHKTTVLDDDEIVTEIQIPRPGLGARSAFVKYALRKAIDFPVVNCAVAINGEQARICLNAVYSNPYRATEAEKMIAGRPVDENLAVAAGEAAVAGAEPLEPNRYKVQIAKVLVKRAVLACGRSGGT